MEQLLALRLAIPSLLIIGLLASVEVGYRLGRRRMRRSRADSATETGAVQGAMLGLLGLLLGFSFAGAGARFTERQDLIGREANAIATASLRAELLEEPAASELKAALAAYVDHRVEASRTLRHGLTAETLDQIAQLHRRIWNAARAGIDARPHSAVLVIGAVNEVIDLHSARIAAGRKHLPGLVMALLGVCSILTLGVLGFAGALGRQRNSGMTSAIALLVAAAFWTTIDLDHPRIGFIKVSDAALIELQAALAKDR